MEEAPDTRQVRNGATGAGSGVQDSMHRCLGGGCGIGAALWQRFCNRGHLHVRSFSIKKTDSQGDAPNNSPSKLPAGTLIQQGWGPAPCTPLQRP